jgi:chromosome segregation ATPase
MTRNRFWHQVGVQLQELLGWETASLSPEDEFDELFRVLRQQTAVLAQARSQLHPLRQQLATQEQELALLTERVQVYFQMGDQQAAWHLALELESCRQVVETQRDEIHAQRQTCQFLRCGVEQTKRRLANLQLHEYFKSNSGLSRPTP